MRLHPIWLATYLAVVIVVATDASEPEMGAFDVDDERDVGRQTRQQILVSDLPAPLDLDRLEGAGRTPPSRFELQARGGPVGRHPRWMWCAFRRQPQKKEQQSDEAGLGRVRWMVVAEADQRAINAKEGVRKDDGTASPEKERNGTASDPDAADAEA